MSAADDRARCESPDRRRGLRDAVRDWLAAMSEDERTLVTVAVVVALMPIVAAAVLFGVRG